MTAQQIPPLFLPHNGTDTSKEAADGARKFASDQSRRVLAYVTGKGADGATRDEISERTGIGIPAVCARVNELVAADILSATSIRRPTRSGKAAEVVVAKEFKP